MISTEEARLYTALRRAVREARDSGVSGESVVAAMLAAVAHEVEADLGLDADIGDRVAHAALDAIHAVVAGEEAS